MFVLLLHSVSCVLKHSAPNTLADTSILYPLPVCHARHENCACDPAGPGKDSLQVVRPDQEALDRYSRCDVPRKRKTDSGIEGGGELRQIFHRHVRGDAVARTSAALANKQPHAAGYEGGQSREPEKPGRTTYFLHEVQEPGLTINGDMRHECRRSITTSRR